MLYETLDALYKNGFTADDVTTTSTKFAEMTAAQESMFGGRGMACTTTSLVDPKTFLDECDRFDNSRRAATKAMLRDTPILEVTGTMHGHDVMYTATPLYLIPDDILRPEVEDVHNVAYGMENVTITVVNYYDTINVETETATGRHDLNVLLNDVRGTHDSLDDCVERLDRFFAKFQ